MSIYIKLVISYILFAFFIILLFMLVLIAVSFFQMHGNVESGSPYAFTSSKLLEKNLSGVMNKNGWVEELDDNYHVQASYGNKETKSTSYSADELLSMANGSEAVNEKYIVVLNKRTDGAGYYLVFFHRSDMKLQPTWVFSNDNSRPEWFYLFILLFMAAFLTLCAAMGHYLSRRIKKPLAQLTAGMKKISSGEEHVLLDFRAEAEFAEIRDTFNHMIESLETARAEKADTEQKKDRMLLDLSHDLRTPIATINSSAAALEEGIVPENEQRKYYHIIRMKAERVGHLAEDMFVMLKMQSEDYHLETTRQDLCEFLRRQCAEYYQDAVDAGDEMEILIPEEKLYYEADYNLLSRVVGNLLGNAIKYNKTGGHIQIHLEQAENTIRLCIADDGETIAPDMQKRLFDDFARGDTARKTDGGTGLGLSIAKAIVEKHRGEIYYKRQPGWNWFVMVLNV